MKIRKIIMGLSLLLTTGYVYAERMAQCKKYWNEVAVQVKVLEDTKCPSSWEDSFNKDNKKNSKRTRF